MNAARWAQVTAIFDDACQRPADERRAWVDAASPDPAIRAEVRAMLDAFVIDPEYLETAVDGGSVERAVADALAGQRLGTYRLVRSVGRGGMGVVYEARRDDDEFDRRVAVKVLPASTRPAEIGRKLALLPEPVR